MKSPPFPFLGQYGGGCNVIYFFAISVVRRVFIDPACVAWGRQGFEKGEEVACQATTKVLCHTCRVHTSWMCLRSAKRVCRVCALAEDLLRTYIHPTRLGRICRRHAGSRDFRRAAGRRDAPRVSCVV